MLIASLIILILDCIALILNVVFLIQIGRHKQYDINDIPDIPEDDEDLHNQSH